jgi:hypothetical protein
MRSLAEELYWRADQTVDLGYDPASFVELIDLGPTAACRKLINDEPPSEWFTRLYELKRLDLSIEALVLQMPYRASFTVDVQNKARGRLQDHGYQP